jgi:outer membrane lipoprotein SlyB
MQYMGDVCSSKLTEEGRFSKMKNKWFAGFGVLLIFGFVFAGCDLDGEDGDTKKDAVELSSETWSNGSITTLSSGGTSEQWFKFTANAAKQYIHVSYSTMNNMNVYVYDNNDNPVGQGTHLNGNSGYGGSDYFYKTLTIGQTYYIKVTAGNYVYNSNTAGTYKIAFSPTFRIPGVAVLELSANAWTNGTITTTSSGGDGEQYFKFTATAATQYIHVTFGTMNNMNVYVYDNNNNPVGQGTHAYGNSGFSETKNTSRSLTPGQTYYIMVTAGGYAGGYYNTAGTYKIAFNTSTSSPS